MNSQTRSELYPSVICLFYYLVAYADGKASQAEIALMDRIATIEKFNKSEFEKQFLIYNQNDRSTTFNKCVIELKKLDNLEQIRILAWMFIISDSDDDFNAKEWKVIQDVLNILDQSLNEILNTERSLTKLLIIG